MCRLESLKAALKEAKEQHEALSLKLNIEETQRANTEEKLTQVTKHVEKLKIPFIHE